MLCRLRVPLILGVGVVLGLLVGCQTLQPGPSDEEQIRALIDNLVEAGNKRDLETTMWCFDDHFEGEMGENKEELSDLFESVFAMEAEFAATEFVVDIAEDGNSAEVKAVNLLQTPYVLALGKTGGTWLITGYRRSQ